MNLYVHYHTKSNNYQSEMARKKSTFKPVGIVVHSTGANNPNLKRYVDYEEVCGKNLYNNHWNGDVNKSPHAFIGKDKNGELAVVQVLPYDIPCWGCGKGKNGSYNYMPTAHLQFEICEDGLTNEEYFQKAMATAQEYCAELCKAYGWDAAVICSHKEANARGYASAHGDPENWLVKHGKTMDWFREQVSILLIPKKQTVYRIGTGWKNGKCQGQVGAFSNIENARAFLKSLSIYDGEGTKQ